MGLCLVLAGPEVATLGGDVTAFLPPVVAEQTVARVAAKLGESSG
jgi:hypothetical protein